MSEMENGGERNLGTKDLAIAVGIGVVGLLAIRWIVTHPDEANRARMAVFLATKRTCYNLADRIREIGDKAGTQYNLIRA